MAKTTEIEHQGTKNLVPMDQRTQEEARALGRIGGIKSGQVRKKKKTMAELAAIMCNSRLSEQKAQEIVAAHPDLEDDDLTVNAAIVGHAASLAINADNRDAIIAAEWVRERQLEAQTKAERAKFTLSILNITSDFLRPYRDAIKALEPYSDVERTDETVRARRVREIISKGGRATAKSTFWAKFAYEQMINDPEAHIVFTRRYKVDLKDSVWSQWYRTVEELGSLDDWTFTTSPMRAVYKPTGQIVYFLGTDNTISKKSFQTPFGYVLIWIAEECDEMQGVEQLDKLEDTFLRKDTPALAIKIFNPPASKSNFMNKYTDEKSIEPSTIVCHSYYYNVPIEWIGQRFMDRAEWFKEHKPLYYANNYLGEATGTGGELFDNVTERKIKKREIANLDTFQGLDFGDTHPQVFIRAAYNPDTDQLYILKEHYRTRSKLSIYLKSIAYKPKTRKVDEKLMDMYQSQETICDSANPDKIRDMQDYGWNAIGSVKRWKGGGRSYSWGWLRNVTEIIIDPALCPKFAEELRTLEFERLKDGTYSSAYPKLGEDGVMATIYAMNRVIMHSSEIDYYLSDEELQDDMEAYITEEE